MCVGCDVRLDQMGGPAGSHGRGAPGRFKLTLPKLLHEREAIREVVRVAVVLRYLRAPLLHLLPVESGVRRCIESTSVFTLVRLSPLAFCWLAHLVPQVQQILAPP